MNKKQRKIEKKLLKMIKVETDVMKVRIAVTSYSDFMVGCRSKMEIGR